LKGGVYIAGLDLLLTSIGFSVLGYVLCYLTLSSNNKFKTQDDSSEELLERGTARAFLKTK